MAPLEKMDHFVNQDVLQRHRRLLSQLKIQPNASRMNVATPPTGLHPSDTHFVNRYANFRSPLGKKVRNLLLKCLTIPLLENFLMLISIRLRPGKQLNGPVIRQTHIRGTLVLNDIQPVTTPLKKMAFAVDKVTLRLPLLITLNTRDEETDTNTLPELLDKARSIRTELPVTSHAVEVLRRIRMLRPGNEIQPKFQLMPRRS